jgi:hypothetical protein
MSDIKWTRVTKSQRCPLCNSIQWCSFGRHPKTEQLVVTCPKTDAPPPGWTLLGRVQDQPGGVYIEGDNPDRGRRPPSWQERHERFQGELSRERDLLYELAEQLRIPSESLTKIGVGWSKREKCWTFPERDAAGNICGIERRYRTGKKMCMKGSRRGIYVPDNFLTLPDPVLLVEGPTDTAACIAIGCAVIGRPNDRAGVELIARRCADRAQHTIVMGEFDPNPERMRWPGLEAAKAVAARLAIHWNERVRYCLPPDGAKDIRAWIGDRLETDEPDAIRAKLLAHLEDQSKWSDPQDAGSVEGLTRDLVSNVVEVPIDGKMKVVPVQLGSIVHQIHKIAEQWPRKIQGEPFIADTEAPPVGRLPEADSWFPLRKAEDLFGWLHGIADVHWADARANAIDPVTGDGRTPATKGELFAAVRQHPRRGYTYDHIELLPHYPELDRVYYLPCELPEPTGKALDEFIDRLNPESERDRDLLLVLLMTLAWGGPPGKRPAFVLKSDHGRGVGKTRTAHLIADVFGGAITVQEHEDWQQVLSRLLDNESLKKRTVLIDNIRGALSRSGLESAVTAPVIDGRKMYVGQAQRPNYLTWIITANTPALSADLTDRSMVVRIGPRKSGSTFETWADTFMREKRAQLIADILELLQQPSLCEIPESEHDRWGPWIHGVLEKLETGRAVLGYARENRDSVNQDLEDANNVLAVIHDILRVWGLTPEQHAARIPKKLLHRELLNAQYISQQKTLKGASMWIDSLRGLPPLRALQDDTRNGSVRCWLWMPPDYNGSEDAGWHSMIHELDLNSWYAKAAPNAGYGRPPGPPMDGGGSHIPI